jgi:RNA polymerase sigma factor (TIGR02999 family)
MSLDTEAALTAVYDELRRLATYHLWNQPGAHSLQATALVHEAYLRLAGQENALWQNRTQFIAVASQMMRRVLVDHARARLTEKRGGGLARISLSEASELSEGREIELLDLDRALGRLTKIDPRKSKLVELRYFGGLAMEEAAEVLDVSLATAERDWKFSRAFLVRELAG